MKEKSICGHIDSINYDRKIDKLNFELVRDVMGIPMIVFHDWSKKRGREILRLHIKEAIQLKAIIDCFVIDYVEYLNEQKGECCE